MTNKSPWPNVSIVITSYNHAHYLADAINSVESQTVKPDEIIVVDDGSTDDPAEIVRRFADASLVRQDNLGLAAARNLGLSRSRGRFVGFLDADDRLTPSAIATNLAQFKKNPECAFVFGAHRHIDKNGKLQGEVKLRRPGKDAFASFLKENLVGMHGTVLYDRDKLLNAGGFDTSLRACEDYDVYLRMSRMHPVACVPEYLADYRHHTNNMSRNNPLMLDSALKALARQKTAASERLDWTAAYNEGVSSWRTYYAGIQLQQLAYAVRRCSGMTRELLNTAFVARLAPRQTFGMLRRRLRRRLDGRKRSKTIGFGDLKRTDPFSQEFGFDRGKPVDRGYVEAFLASHASDIQGRVLEIGDNSYTVRFGGSKVDKSDILNVNDGNPESTFIADLTTGHGLPDGAFDCIILTQTLHLLFDLQRAVSTLWRILKPGGVLLVTVPWVSSIDRGEWGNSWYWSISPLAMQRLLAGEFGANNVSIKTFGNVYAATGFLYGLAEHELDREALDADDPYCPVIVAACVRKQDKP
jgi:SAM-dependent methyltransferase